MRLTVHKYCLLIALIAVPSSAVAAAVGSSHSLEDRKAGILIEPFPFGLVR